MAYDSCNPSQKTVAIVKVSVTRNANRPVFSRKEYSVTIEETVSLGREIAKVDARDLDPVSGSHFVGLK